ncbi:MAG: cadherin domain-containing protein [Planctomycetales bacterium]|nr:cadherin domain-containing protein [Planctomycetales bacterium]
MWRITDLSGSPKAEAIEILPGDMSPSPQSLELVDGVLYFSAYGGPEGRQLWRYLTGEAVDAPTGLHLPGILSRVLDAQGDGISLYEGFSSAQIPTSSIHGLNDALIFTGYDVDGASKLMRFDGISTAVFGESATWVLDVQASTPGDDAVYLALSAPGRSYAGIDLIRRYEPSSSGYLFSGQSILDNSVFENSSSFVNTARATTNFSPTDYSFSNEQLIAKSIGDLNGDDTDEFLYGDASNFIVDKHLVTGFDSDRVSSLPDINHDSYDEIALFANGDLRIFFGSPTLGNIRDSQPDIVVSGVSDSASVTRGDFDGDGATDLAIIDPASNSLRTFSSIGSHAGHRLKASEAELTISGESDPSFQTIGFPKPVSRSLRSTAPDHLQIDLDATNVLSIGQNGFVGLSLNLTGLELEETPIGQVSNFRAVPVNNSANLRVPVAISDTLSDLVTKLNSELSETELGRHVEAVSSQGQIVFRASLYGNSLDFAVNEFSVTDLHQLSMSSSIDFDGDSSDDILFVSNHERGFLSNAVENTTTLHLISGIPVRRDLPSVFDTLENFSVAGSGSFVVDRGTGRPELFDNGGEPFVVAAGDEQWFKFTTLGDGKAGDTIRVLGGESAELVDGEGRVISRSRDQMVRTEPYSANVMADDPTVYLKFEETSGTTAVDSTGNGHSGLYSGGPSLNVSGVAERTGTAMGLDGINDKATVNVPITSSFSAEVWARSKTPVWDEYGWLISSRAKNGFLLHPSAGSRSWSGSIVDNAIPQNVIQIGSHTPSDIQGWHHYAITYDGTTARMFFDGTLVVESLLSVSRDAGPSNINIDLGFDNCCGGTRYGNGALDEFALFSTALTPADIQDRFNARLPVFNSLPQEPVFDLRTLEAGTYYLRVSNDGTENQSVAIEFDAPARGQTHETSAHPDRDLIRGGDGDDFIVGNSGLDRLFGDSGNDQFTAEPVEIRDLQSFEASKLPPASELSFDSLEPVLDPVVDFANESLQAAVADAIGIPVTYSGNQPIVHGQITESQLTPITSLDVSDGIITNQVTPSEDTYVSVTNEADGNADALWAIGAAGFTRIPLVKFDLSSFAGETVVEDVVLNFIVRGTTNNSSTPTAVDLYEFGKSWNESSTWNSIGGISAVDYVGAALDRQTVAFVSSNPTTHTISYRVPSRVIQGWIDHPNSNHGFALVSTQTLGNNPDITFFSSESASPPKLTFKTSIGNRDLADLGLQNGVNRFPYLNSLDVSGNPGITTISALPSLDELTSLQLAGTNVEPASASTLQTLSKFELDTLTLPTGVVAPDTNLIVQPGAAVSMPIELVGVELDGVNDSISLGATAGQLGFNGNFTASAWIRPDDVSVGKDHTIFGSGTGLTDQGLHFMIRNGKLRHDFYANSTVGNADLIAGQWVHVTFRFNNGEQAIFIDGELDAATTGHTNYAGNLNVTLGDGPIPSDFFDGLIDSARIFNRALSDAEIVANMNGTLDVSGPDVTADYRFNENRGNTAADRSTRRGSATLQNGTAWVAFTNSTSWNVSGASTASGTSSSIDFTAATEGISFVTVQGERFPIIVPTAANVAPVIDSVPSFDATIGGVDLYEGQTLSIGTATPTELVVLINEGLPSQTAAGTITISDANPSDIPNLVTAVTVTDPAGQTTSLIQNALAFDDDALAISHEALDGATNLTVAFWLDVNHPNAHTILSGANDDEENAFAVALLNSTTLRVVVNGQPIDWTIPASDDGFHHFAIVRNLQSGAESLTVYRDGRDDQLVNPQSLPDLSRAALSIADGGLLLGQDQDFVGGGFEADEALHGTLDEFAIWNRALTKDEIAEVRSGNIITNDSTMRLYLPFDEGNGSIVVDRGPLGLDARLDGIVSPASQYSVPAGAILHYSFDDPTAIGADQSGNSNISTNFPGVVTSKNGISGRAANFTTNVSSIKIDSPVDASATWTGAAWFKNIDSNSFNTLFFRGSSIHQALVQGSTNKLGVWNGAFQESGYIVDVPGWADQWHHLTVVGDGSKTSFYIDGLLVGTSPVHVHGLFASIGNRDTSNQRFAEFLDEVYLYNRALNPTEVQSLYLADASFVPQFTSDTPHTLDTTYRLPDDGIYTLTVTASDGDGGFDRSVTTFEVNNVVPYRPGAADPIAGPHYVGDSIELTARDVRDDGAEDELSYLWEVTTNNGQAVESSDKIDFSFTPQYSGRYSVQLTVTDSDGGQSSFPSADYDVIPTARISDGANGWLTFDDGPGIELPGSTLNSTLNGTGDLSVQFSIRTNVDSDQVLLDAFSPSQTEMRVSLTDSGRVVRIESFAEATGQSPNLVAHDFALPAPLSNNQWRRIAIVRNAATGQTELFVDGQSAGVRGLPIDPQTSYVPLNVSYVHVGSGLTGSLDNVQIWNSVRTAEQIRDDDAVEIRSSQGLTGWWALNELDGDNQVIDQSGHKNHGQLVSPANTTRDRFSGGLRVGDFVTLSGEFSTPVAPAGDLRGKNEIVRREYHWFADDESIVSFPVNDLTQPTKEYSPTATGMKEIKLIVVDIFETAGADPTSAPTTAELCALDNVLCSEPVTSTLQVGEQAIAITPAVASADEGGTLEFSVNSALPINLGDDVVAWTATLYRGSAHEPVWQTSGNALDFSVTPPGDGTLEILLSVTTSTDSECRVHHAVPISVTIDNVAPVAANDHFTVDANKTLEFTDNDLLANDLDPGVFDTLEVGMNPLSELGVQLTDGPNGAYLYDPSSIADIQKLAFGESRTDRYNYTVRDDAFASDNAVLTITINGVNDDPVPAADSLSVPITPLSVSGSGNVLDNDSDIDTSASLSVVRFGDRLHDSQDFIGQYGTISWNRNGSFNYRADMSNPEVRGLLATQTLSEVIPYVVSDGIAEVGSSLTVTLEGTNHGPTDISIDSASFDENTAGAMIGHLSVTDPDLNDVFRFTVSDDRFEVVNGTLKLVDGVALDYESEPSVSLDIDVFDFAGKSFSKTLTLIVNDLNEHPSVVDQAFVIDENSPDITPVGDVIATDVDQGDTLTFSIIGGSGRDAFQIDPASGQISVANGALLDFETGPSMTLEVEVKDEDGLSDTAIITITINDIDETPAPRLEWVSINEDGDHSSVRFIDVLFDSVVTIDDGAFQVASSDGTSIGVQAEIQHTNGKTSARLTFLDPTDGTDLVEDSGSLRDGNYTLTILDSHVRSQSGKLLDGDRDGLAGTPRVDEFFRLFGDSDGDRDVDVQDYGRFATTFMKSLGDAGFDAAFDFDGDGDVDGQDLGRFEQAFLRRLEL